MDNALERFFNKIDFNNLCTRLGNNIPKEYTFTYEKENELEM